MNLLEIIDPDAVSTHAEARLRDRLDFLDDRERERIMRTAQETARFYRRERVAFVVKRFDRQVGTPWGEASNGDILVAVARYGVLVTLMLRRHSQTFTRAKFGVDRVLLRR